MKVLIYNKYRDIYPIANDIFEAMTSEPIGFVNEELYIENRELRISKNKNGIRSISVKPDEYKGTDTLYWLHEHLDTFNDFAFKFSEQDFELLFNKSKEAYGESEIHDSMLLYGMSMNDDCFFNHSYSELNFDNEVTDEEFRMNKAGTFYFTKHIWYPEHSFEPTTTIQRIQPSEMRDTRCLFDWIINKVKDPVQFLNIIATDEIDKFLENKKTMEE